MVESDVLVLRVIIFTSGYLGAEVGEVGQDLQKLLQRNYCHILCITVCIQ